MPKLEHPPAFLTENLLNKLIHMERLSWGCGRLKTEGFRPTEKTKAIIDMTEKRKNILNRTHAINWLIERGSSEELEHPKMGDSSKYPPNLYCQQDDRFYTKEKMLQECEGCQFKISCTAWMEIP